MLILSVETSGRTGSIALFDDNVCLQQRSLETAGRRHAQTLVLEVRNLFQHFNHPLTSCDVLAVSHGPGSFTGLRVGIVFAKTMAYTTGCKIIAVNSLQTIAQRCPDKFANVHVITDAQRGDVFTNEFAVESGRRVAQGTTRVLPADSWLQTVKPEDAVTGTGVTRFDKLLADHPNCLAEDLRQPTAEALGQTAIQMLDTKILDTQPFTDPFQLEPLYLRKSSAEEKWDAQNAVD